MMGRGASVQMTFRVRRFMPRRVTATGVQSKHVFDGRLLMQQRSDPDGRVVGPVGQASHDLTVMVRDLCETMGNTPANATMREIAEVIPNWIESTKWTRATDDDKFRGVAFGQLALCPQYDAFYDAWAAAGWPPLYE